jgi:hypothetical protein
VLEREPLAEAAEDLAGVFGHAVTLTARNPSLYEEVRRNRDERRVRAAGSPIEEFLRRRLL